MPDTSGSESLNDGYGVEGQMEIDLLRIQGRSLRSLYLELGGKILDGSRIGWVSSIKVRLLYGDRLVAKATVRDIPLVLDEQNNMKIEWNDKTGPEMKIKDMRFFQSFIEDMMPAESISNLASGQKRTVADLVNSSAGHKLIININLEQMARMRVTARNIVVTRNGICMTVEITNLSPFSMFFDNVYFHLKKGNEIVGELAGDLDIVPGVFEVDLIGSFTKRVSGMATLKGDEFHAEEDSWQYYAIKLFQVEVNLDEAVADSK